MSAVTIAVGTAFSAMFGGAIFAWWHGYRDLFSILFVACIALLAVAIPYARVGQHMEQTAATEAALHPPALPASGVLGGPATVLPMRAAEMTAVTGSTAPPGFQDPYAGAP
jgi:hypothetical protein